MIAFIKINLKRLYEYIIAFWCTDSFPERPPIHQKNATVITCDSGGDERKLFEKDDYDLCTFPARLYQQKLPDEEEYLDAS